ncbi:hypothetical protein D3C86_1368490 [compost metagenome]
MAGQLQPLGAGALDVLVLGPPAALEIAERRVLDLVLELGVEIGGAEPIGGAVIGQADLVAGAFLGFQFGVARHPAAARGVDQRIAVAVQDRVAVLVLGDHPDQAPAAVAARVGGGAGAVFFQGRRAEALGHAAAQGPGLGRAPDQIGARAEVLAVFVVAVEAAA